MILRIRAAVLVLAVLMLTLGACASVRPMSVSELESQALSQRSYDDVDVDWGVAVEIRKDAVPPTRRLETPPVPPRAESQIVSVK